MASTTARTQETNENFNMKACLNDLTKIPQKEFEAQFRNWMEKDGVARAMQAKLRADLVANFNKTNLGKHIIGQSPTNRLTLSPMEMALNTLVAEFLFAQNCHFTLSVYSTEAPFRNTLPDFDSLKHFRFNENEVTEIIKAICGTTNYDWNINNIIFKNYTTNKSISLLFYILKALLDRNAEAAQHKVSVGTNTKPFKMTPSSANEQQLLTSDLTSPQPTHKDSKAEFYNTNFRYLNRYLIILSRKVKDMSEQFQKLQYQGGGVGQPRVRVFKSMGQRKYEDLNRSLERVTENLKQMANARRKSKRVSTIVKAIESLASQFQKCAENFEHVSKDLKTSSRSKVEKSVTSSESQFNQAIKNSSVTTTAAASQTDLNVEKAFGDWLHEMRYTRNGQKFLDRIERSFLKALEKQKRELSVENEVKLRHQKELMRIRYKQKALQEICSHGSQSTHRCEFQPTSNVQNAETVSEQFRQFELKHFDLLSKIYESETENKANDSRNFKEIQPKTTTTEKVVHFDVKENDALIKTSSELESCDLKLTSSSENIEQPRQILKEKNVNDIRQQVKAAIGEIVAEERNVDQIVMDAKVRIRELEHESNQLTENFLGYLGRQREQKLAAQQAAQSLWNDYMNEREKMQERYNSSSHESKIMFSDKETLRSSEIKELGDIASNQGDLRETLELFLREHRKRIVMPTNENEYKQQKIKKAEPVSSVLVCKDSGSESSSSYMELKNPIIEAKEHFFERERQFKAENSKHLLEEIGMASKIDFNDFLKLNECTSSSGDMLKTITTTTAIGPLGMMCLPSKLPLTKEPIPKRSLMATFLSESQSGTNTDLSTQGVDLRAFEMAAAIETATSTSHAQLPSNWRGSSLLASLPQNISVNKSQRREIIATAKEAMRNQKITKITTNAILAAAAAQAANTATTTNTTVITPIAATIARALNKNNADGASVAEVQQEHSNNYKIKSDAGYGQEHTTSMEHRQKQSQQLQHKQQSVFYNDKNNYNMNKTNNIKSNVSTEFRAAIVTETSSMASSTVQTSKTSLPLPKPKVSDGGSGTELSRRAVLKQTMARMQQLFSSHQQQQQQQQIMLPDVSEEEENWQVESKQELQIPMGNVEKSLQKQKIALQSINHNNNNNNNINKYTTNTQSRNVVDYADSENVVGHYENNFLLKQKIAKQAAKDQREQLKQQQDQQKITEQSKITTTNRTTSMTLHSIDEGNKTVETLVDWQQIACGPSGRQNEAKVNADKVKVTNAVAAAAAKEIDNELLDEYDDDDFEKDIKEVTMNLPHELGEILERNQTSTEAINQAEIGELIEHSDDVRTFPTPAVSGASLSTSEVSSVDLQLPVVGRSGSGRGGNERGVHGRSRFNMEHSGAISAANGSDSGSDFWA